MPVDILQTHAFHHAGQTALAEKFTVHKLHEAADPEALLAQIGPQIKAIAGGDVSAELIARLPALEIVATFGVGYDSVDVQAAAARDIVVANTPEVLNDAVAELAIGLMIALARRIPQADRYVREGRWGGKKFGLTGELTGKTVGILGLGRIGKEIAARAQAMKMRVVYHGRHEQANQPFVYYSDLEDMARDSDWLMVIAPGGAGTAGLVSRKVLEALGPEGAVVNLGRGTVIDEAAMLELLKSGGLGGAALDVFENEPEMDEAFFGLENVVLSPHQGSATEQTRTLMGLTLVENLDAHFAGRPVPHRVV
ncbi:2-hydroxyacid dehydrogenase [Pelagibacterium montanilacus]|uniref:2-hydroxyacid dehydrogenase n=1 Tax=Pelagibacterium montanilacus TaxID=2185280 RepID=UPI000F8D8352|nr:2-hydroxyacid dehydrogenase [Pelagibacterium montanilacus]